MKKIPQKILTLALVLSMSVSLLSMAAFALEADAEQSGEPETAQTAESVAAADSAQEQQNAENEQNTSDTASETTDSTKSKAEAADAAEESVPASDGETGEQPASGEAAVSAVPLLMLTAQTAPQCYEIDLDNEPDHRYEIAQDSVYTDAVSGETDYYVFSGTGTVTLNAAVLQAPSGASAIALAPGAAVTLEITGACSLAGGANGAGIAVPSGASVTISGAGSLTAVGNAGSDASGSGAGIGGMAADGSSGTITIDRLASLTAEGYGTHACGIGSAKDGSSGSISISNTVIVSVKGGFVQNDVDKGYGPGMATQYGNKDPEGGAAIGGGGKGGACGDITLKEVTLLSALGGSKAAAIGGTCWADCGTITIVSSSLSGVLGGCTAAGIGLSRVNASSAGADVEIKIEKSSVSCQGGVYGAGIGAGYNGDSIGNQSNSTLKDKSLGVTGISIAGSTVSVIGGNAGAGIGGGYKSWGQEISIDGASTVYARGGIAAEKSRIAENGASAIGSGADGSGVFAGGTVSIADGASVIAVSNGGKWAIDLRADTTAATACVLQGRFLNDTLMSKAQGFNFDPAAVAADGENQILDVSKENELTMGGSSVTLPAGYTCAAVTVAKAGETYAVSSVNGGFTTLCASSVGAQTTSVSDRQVPASQEIHALYTPAAGVSYYDYLAFRPSAAVYAVNYEFTGSVPSGVAVPAAAAVQSGGSYTVDTGSAYGPMSGVLNGQSGTFSFGGWDQTGAITVNGSVTVHGNWTFTPASNSSGGDDGNDTPAVIPNAAVPAVEIPETAVPAAETPAGETPAGETADIPDEAVPLEQAPQAQAPETGDQIMLWIAVDGICAAGLIWLCLSGRKKKGKREDESK